MLNPNPGGNPALAHVRIVQETQRTPSPPPNRISGMRGDLVSFDASHMPGARRKLSGQIEEVRRKNTLRKQKVRSYKEGFCVYSVSVKSLKQTVGEHGRRERESAGRRCKVFRNVYRLFVLSAWRAVQFFTQTNLRLLPQSPATT